MCVCHSAYSQRPRLFEKCSCWDPAVSAISSRDGMMMVASADVNAKRQAGGDENRMRAVPPRAPCPLRAPCESKSRKYPKQKTQKSNVQPFSWYSLRLCLRLIEPPLSGQRVVGHSSFLLARRVNRAPCRAREGGLGAESLNLTTRHYALTTKAWGNPTCLLFTAATSLLLFASSLLRGGPLMTELNYHGNSHR